MKDSVRIDADAMQTLLSLQQAGKPDLIDKIISLFENNSPDLIDAIEKGFETGDNDSVRAAAHSLKSSAAYIGGAELSSMCKKIEKAAANDALSDEADRVQAIADCYRMTLAEVKSILNDPGKAA